MSQLNLLTMTLRMLIPSVYAWPGPVIILLITVQACRQLRQVGKRLDREKRLLSHCRAGLAYARQSDAPIGQNDIEVWVSGIVTESVVARAVRAVWSARLVNNPDLEAIDAMLRQGESARLSFARSAPNLLLLAGLFGTVIGLAGMVATLGPQIEGTLHTSDPLTLTRNLGETLRHMQNAFACTLWGILASIVVAMWTRKLTARQSDLLAQVQEFGIREFAPMIFPLATGAQFDDLRVLLRQSSAFLRDITTLMEASAGKFETVLTNAGAAMGTSIEQLREVATGMRESLSGVSGDVRRSAETLERSSSDVRESAQALNAYHQDLRNAYTEIRTIFDASQAALSELSGQQLRQIAQMEQGFAASTDRTIAQLQQNAGDLAGTTDAFRKAGERFLDSGMETQSHLDRGFARLVEQLDAALEGHRQEMGHVEDSVRLIAQRLADLTERLDPRLLPEGEWRAVSEALTRCVEELRGLGERPPAAFPAAARPVGELSGMAGLPGGGDLSLNVDRIHALLRQGDVHTELREINAALHAIKQVIAPSRRHFFGIPLPGRWFASGEK